MLTITCINKLCDFMSSLHNWCTVVREPLMDIGKLVVASRMAGIVVYKHRFATLVATETLCAGVTN